MPREPSLPPPDSTIATARGPQSCASERKNTSIGSVSSCCAIALAQQQAPAGDDHLLLRRDQIDVVRLDQHAVLDEVDRQLGVPREELVHQALEVRRQVLDDHERHAGVLRHVVEEALERFEPAGGSADADDVLGRLGSREPSLLRRHRPLREARKPIPNGQCKQRRFPFAASRKQHMCHALSG